MLCSPNAITVPFTMDVILSDPNQFGFDDILRDGRNIRVHPNGFIQIDLPENLRVHVWHNHLKQPERVSTGIHDHVYGFRSLILAGELLHSWYRIKPVVGGEFTIYEAHKTDREDSELKLVLSEHELSKIRSSTMHAGQWYTIDPLEFHLVDATLCATVIETFGAIPDAKARVVFHNTSEPLKNFSRYQYDPGQLWELVEDVLG